MKIDFIWFTIIVFLPIIVVFSIPLIVEHFYIWWVQRQENNYIERAQEKYKENPND